MKKRDRVFSFILSFLLILSFILLAAFAGVFREESLRAVIGFDSDTLTLTVLGGSYTPDEALLHGVSAFRNNLSVFYEKAIPSEIRRPIIKTAAVLGTAAASVTEGLFSFVGELLCGNV